MRELSAVVFGALLALAGVVLLPPLPELGVPALLAGLRLLGRRYAWARRANDRVDAAWRRAHDAFHRQSRAVRWAVTAILLALALLLGLLSVSTVRDHV